MRPIIAGLVAFGACSEPHPAARVEVAATDCIACHTTDYEDTTIVDHVAFGFPTSCAACHLSPPAQPDWTPVETDLAGTCDTPCRRHPEHAFPITGAPHDLDVSGQPMRCTACHNFALGPDPTLGANTDCTGACHLRTGGTAGAGSIDDKHLLCGAPGCPVPGYAWNATNPHFCLSCHPAGE